MQNQRQMGLIVFIIGSVNRAGLMGVCGLSDWKDGLEGITSAATHSDPRLVQSPFPYFKYYMRAGALRVLAGLSHVADLWGSWNSEEWGSKTGLLAGSAIGLAWALIKFVSLSFRDPPPFIGRLVGLPAPTEVRDYCTA